MEGSFSAVSTLIFANKSEYSFRSAHLHNVRTSAPLQTQNVGKNRHFFRDDSALFGKKLVRHALGVLVYVFYVVLFYPLSVLLYFIVS